MTKTFHCLTCGGPLTFQLVEESPKFGPETLRAFAQGQVDFEAAFYDNAPPIEKLIISCKCGDAAIHMKDYQYLSENLCDKIEIRHKHST